MLPVKNIYINSNFKTADSESDSNFKFQLTRTFSFPKNSVFYIENFTCSHAWYSVEQNINDAFYVLVDNVMHTSYITPGNYTGDTFTTALQTALNNMVSNIFTVSYNTSQNNIKITVAGSHTFKILTDIDAKTIGYNTTTINNMLQNSTGTSQIYSSSNPYISGFIELLSIKNIYLHSPNLSSFTTYGGKGESNIIKKVPVSSDFGYLIIENFTSTHDYLSCASLSIGCLEFQLRDSIGNIVPLHGANVSFSIVFSKISEEDN
jgi:hypothetical protein